MFNSQISAIQYNGDSGKVLRASSDGYKKLLKGLVEKKMTTTSIHGNNVTTSFDADNNEVYGRYDIFNYNNEGNLINNSFLWDEDEDKI